MIEDRGIPSFLESTLSKKLQALDEGVNITELQIRAEIAAQQEWLRRRWHDAIPEGLHQRVANRIAAESKVSTSVPFRGSLRTRWLMGCLSAAAAIVLLMISPAFRPVPAGGVSGLGDGVAQMRHNMERGALAKPEVGPAGALGDGESTLSDLESLFSTASDEFDQDIQAAFQDIEGLVWKSVVESDADDDWS